MSPFVMGVSLMIAGFVIVLRIIAWPAAVAISIWLITGLVFSHQSIPVP
jgi:hypothetical protein